MGRVASAARRVGKSRSSADSALWPTLPHPTSALPRPPSPLREGRLKRQSFPQFPRQVADELPGDAAGARAAKLRPLQGSAVEVTGFEVGGLQPIALGIALDGFEIGRL